MRVTRDAPSKRSQEQTQARSAPGRASERQAVRQALRDVRSEQAAQNGDNHETDRVGDKEQGVQDALRGGVNTCGVFIQAQGDDEQVDAHEHPGKKLGGGVGRRLAQGEPGSTQGGSDLEQVSGDAESSEQGDGEDQGANFDKISRLIWRQSG